MDIRSDPKHTSDAHRPLSTSDCPVLVLNADFRPLSYFPLSTISWQDAIKAIFMDRVETLAHYDRTIASAHQEWQLPSVIALKEYYTPKRRPAFTRFNVFLRDNFTCQYTGEKFPVSELTFDHLIPRSRGGRTCWENIVTASREANTRKGNKLPQECKMHPIQKPVEPTMFELQERGRKFPPRFLHETWRDYLYWDSELERGE
jgi:5-methylcytosine-specific restriction endonuclease McrA